MIMLHMFQFLCEIQTIWKKKKKSTLVDVWLQSMFCEGYVWMNTRVCTRNKITNEWAPTKKTSLPVQALLSNTLCVLVGELKCELLRRWPCNLEIKTMHEILIILAFPSWLSGLTASSLLRLPGLLKEYVEIFYNSVELIQVLLKCRVPTLKHYIT